MLVLVCGHAHAVFAVGDGAEIAGISFGGFLVYLFPPFCSYHFVEVYKMMGSQCSQRFDEPVHHLEVLLPACEFPGLSSCAGNVFYRIVVMRQAR